MLLPEGCKRLSVSCGRMARSVWTAVALAPLSLRHECWKTHFKNVSLGARHLPEIWLEVNSPHPQSGAEATAVQTLRDILAITLFSAPEFSADTSLGSSRTSRGTPR